ncbi:conserved hypothetical protein [Syntrophomonas wolfei subsp. wolfei str. Goettingen G311]|uniref:Putative restriction endonuclease domain-containing protein n=1 Tax=Syntrophomonas wolfei subsp. wolfei (strain DSM 2245B / Goettingen) TaxID=335541 RepID=Q0AYY2_SYNWW|nr:conserved hypothetical protein [Syntrophomonas wolfei subsp. wolfei str. Goettingen G311]
MYPTGLGGDIVNVSSKKRKEKYTYADYLNWPDGERWEIIGGKPYLMSPAPSRQHQQILGALFAKIYNYLEDKACQVYPAPFDVRLSQENNNDDEIDTVVQPDIVVVCDEKKLDNKGCKGAPDIIIEIISQSTAKKDLNEKFNLYERCGVKEYWVIFPWEKTVDIYCLNQNYHYEKTSTYFAGDTLKSDLFPGWEIDLASVFK